MVAKECLVLVPLLRCTHPPPPQLNINLNNIFTWKYPHKNQGSHVRDYSTWVKHRNKKRFIKEGRKDRFILPPSSLPQALAAQLTEKHTLSGKRRVKWALHFATDPGLPHIRMAAMAVGSHEHQTGPHNVDYRSGPSDPGSWLTPVTTSPLIHHWHCAPGLLWSQMGLQWSLLWLAPLDPKSRSTCPRVKQQVYSPTNSLTTPAHQRTPAASPPSNTTRLPTYNLWTGWRWRFCLLKPICKNQKRCPLPQMLYKVVGSKINIQKSIVPLYTNMKTL